MKASRVVGSSFMLVGLAAASLGVSGVAGASTSGAGATTSRPSAASSSPPGNNGTIKIDNVPLVDVGQPDDHANHPHVSCTLALSFFGFDATTNDATVAFNAQPPSGTGPVTVTEGPTSFTFTGYGPGDTLDYSAAYQLDVSGLVANPQQGYHIKVTVDVSNPGTVSAADEKYKVFWYEPCGAPLSTTTTTTTTKLGVGQGTTTTTAPSTTTTTTTPKVAASQGTTTTLAPVTTTTRPPQSTPPGQQVALGASSSGAPESAVSSGAPESAVSSGAPESAASSGAPQESANSALPASSPAVELPAGAGTDLGFFKPASWARSAGPSWDLLIAGGLLMLLTGGLIRRRK